MGLCAFVSIQNSIYELPPVTIHCYNRMNERVRDVCDALCHTNHRRVHCTQIVLNMYNKNEDDGVK